MTSRTTRSGNGLSFAEKLAIMERELTVVAIVLAELLDKRQPTEADWQRITLSLHRIRALQEVR